jgi:signal transduction histidine kinase/CheY-like chemotaxis protein/HPt (histidine-containing phosphotransfer) domain-containing protein
VGKWFRQILQGEHSLFRLSLPFRVRLFNVLALVGGMISLINGISSYANNQDSVILGLNLGIAVLSFVLLFYAYKSGRYQFCYVVTIIMIFLMMFPYLFFKSGGYKGGMVSFYIFGILFTVFMLEGKVMFFTAFMEMAVYIATIMIAYQNPQMVVWFSSEKEVVMDLLIGFCASSISVAAVMYLHFRMYNKQQEILEEARIEAQSANKAKSAFLANMSHEIRTPINVMLGMNEMILRESESEEIRQYAKSIERSGGYLISLINNILDISRIESGKMEIEEGKYELRQLLDEVMLIAEKQAEQKSLKMNLIFDKTLPAYLIGDVIHIKQILLNLINNAVKYTKEGQIDIKVSKNAEETKLIFEVKDTGIGIKEENLPILFDAFMRVDSKKNKKIKGTGLGLAIAKQLVEQMDGMIWVESVYGKGSSFFVQFPMKKVSDGKISNVEWKETDERKRRSFVAPRAKILIVDDNPENLMVTRSLLKRTAVFVDTAASGEECVHKVRQNIYDLILLDYMMPQMDGIDTLRELKKDVQFHIPVIALTADVTKGIEQTFLREGFCAYLSKPVMWSKLEDLLMKYLRDDLVFIREDLKEEQKIKDEEFKQLKGQLKENDIKIEEGLRLLDGDFMQYRKLMEFFTEYQEEYMRQMQQLMTQKEVKVDEITRMMHTLKSNAKAIGAIHLYEIAKEMEDRGKQKDMEYIMSAYDLLKLEWRRVFKASREFIEQTKNVLFDQKKEEEKDKQSKEEIKEKLKIFITRYQAKEAKEQIQYYRKGKISEEEKNILKEIEERIDQLDFDEAEILMKRWEGME